MEKEKEIERELKKLYVGNLDYSLKNEDLEELFKEYGTVKNCFIVKGKGFGFVEFETEEEASKAKDALDESLFQERALNINFALPKKNKSYSR